MVAERPPTLKPHTVITPCFQSTPHDAAEAFIGDITRPLKQLLPEYKAIEANVEAAIYSRFSLNQMATPHVKLADLRVLAAEQAQLMIAWFVSPTAVTTASLPWNAALISLYCRSLTS